MSFCSNCGSSLSEDMKFCPSCGKGKSGAPHENKPSQEKNAHVKKKNKIGLLKKIAVFIAISIAISVAAVFYIGNKAQIKFEAASNQLKCDTENDGEACFLYANYIDEEVHAYEVNQHYLDKACALIPETDNLERLANICADAGNLKAACNFKHAESCYEDGKSKLEQFLKTRGQKPKENSRLTVTEIEHGFQTVRKSCDFGYNEGCDLYVRSVFHSQYHYLDFEHLNKFATKACEAGYQTSCYFIKIGYFAAYGNIGELKDNAPLNYIRRKAPRLGAAAFDSGLSGRCTATVNLSKYGEVERIIELSCNHKAFKKVMEEELNGSVYFPLILDGRPTRRINETITKEYKIEDGRGRVSPFK